MGIKDKLFGKESSIYSGKEKEEFPDDFKENTKVIKESEDEDIAAFIRKKKSQKEEKEKPIKEELEKPVEKPVAPESVQDKSPVSPTQSIEEDRVSNFAKIITVYMKPDDVEKTKETLKESVNAGFLIGLQAGIQITKENVEEVNSILRYLADNKWLVVVSGEQVEPLFDATK